MTEHDGNITLHRIKSPDSQASITLKIALGPLVEEAERRGQNLEHHAILLAVEQTERNLAKQLAEDYAELERKYEEVCKENVELRSQIWKQKPM